MSRLYSMPTCIIWPYAKRRGVVNIFSVLSVCQMITCETAKALTQEVHICKSSISPGNTGQVRIGRSSGQSQGPWSDQKGRKFLLPQCKSFIGNNSRSIKHTAMKFACNMRFFSAMADQTVWPPSLSRDRKWPSVTKCTHSRVVASDLGLKGIKAFV